MEEKDPSTDPLQKQRDAYEAVLENQVQWVTLQLSHHILSKRSIYFVLDCQFEQYKWFETCRHFIIDTFAELHDEDHFGLLSL